MIGIGLMMIDAYRTKSARADYPAEPTVRQPDGVRTAAGRPVLGERAGGNAPAIDDFDSPHPADVEEAYRPPRGRTDARVQMSIYVIIVLGMVLIFVLGFRPGFARPF